MLHSINAPTVHVTALCSTNITATKAVTNTDYVTQYKHTCRTCDKALIKTHHTYTPRKKRALTHTYNILHIPIVLFITLPSTHTYIAYYIYTN
jgi:hypothetical protein